MPDRMTKTFPRILRDLEPTEWFNSVAEAGAILTAVPSVHKQLVHVLPADNPAFVTKHSIDSRCRRQADKLASHLSG